MYATKAFLTTEQHTQNSKTNDILNYECRSRTKLKNPGNAFCVTSIVLSLNLLQNHNELLIGHNYNLGV